MKIYRKIFLFCQFLAFAHSAGGSYDFAADELKKLNSILSRPSSLRSKKKPAIGDLQKLNAQVVQLNHCNDKNDCHNTQTDRLWCSAPSTCGDCGILIHKSEMNVFLALSSKAIALSHPDCPFYDSCGGHGCIMECASGRCQGIRGDRPVD